MHGEPGRADARPAGFCTCLDAAARRLRCAATAHNLSGSREILLATYRGHSPRLAARWLLAEAHHLARLLSPDPDARFLQDAPLTTAGPHVPRPDAELRAWPYSDRAYEHTAGPTTAGGEDGTAWAVTHLKANPGHLDYGEHIVRPYRAEPGAWL